MPRPKIAYETGTVCLLRLGKCLKKYNLLERGGVPKHAKLEPDSPVASGNGRTQEITTPCRSLTDIYEKRESLRLILSRAVVNSVAVLTAEITSSTVGNDSPPLLNVLHTRPFSSTVRVLSG